MITKGLAFHGSAAIKIDQDQLRRQTMKAFNGKLHAFLAGIEASKEATQ